MMYNNLFSVCLHWIAMTGLVFGLVLLLAWMIKYMKGPKLLSVTLWILALSLVLSVLTFNSANSYMGSMMKYWKSGEDADFQSMMNFDYDEK